MSDLFIVRLTPNQAKVQTSIEERQNLGKGHHEFIENLVTDKIIQFGGPIEGKPGGMLIVQSTSIEDVRNTFNEDPLIKNEYLNCEINKWTIKHGNFPDTG
ncbi:MAG: YciI family protein [Candidatus Kariarchaeaceae archaeon]|jgi:uncharacterized protein YciI